jgi:geranylgeranyl diphosphate synthase type I
MTGLTVSTGLDTAAVRVAVDAVLSDVLDRMARLDPALRAAELVTVLRDFLEAGGKRIRPVLCLCGWYAASGRGAVEPVVRTAAALELFHAFALIHDDVMDDSDDRRGRPTAHRALSAGHRERGDSGDAERFGTNSAILLGDLSLVWSDELLHTAGLTHSQLNSALPLFDMMRTEVLLGQYLDVQATGQLDGDLDRALTVIRYKTAKYTVERPLHIGAVLAGADAATLSALTTYAIPVGEAFQLRDDLLGVFGDPEQTGKPVLDDLREGKNTALMALAVQRAEPAQLRTLKRLVGEPDLDENGAAAVRAVLEDTGARDVVEQMITTRLEQALAALSEAPFPTAGAESLRAVAHAAAVRSS